MRIGSVQSSPAFKMKIVQNEELHQLIHHLQVDRGYSQKKIEKIMSNIKKMADDSYEFEVQKVHPCGMMLYDITTDNEDAAVDERGGDCSTRAFFMLRNIKKLCNTMIKINKNAGSEREIYEKAGK